MISGSPMSLKSSNYSSKVVNFDHRNMLCLSPPANVNGAPLPTSSKGSRMEKHKSAKQANVPTINLQKVINKANTSNKAPSEKDDPYQDISMLDKMVVPNAQKESFGFNFHPG